MFTLEKDTWLASKERILAQMEILTTTWKVPSEFSCLGGSAAMVMLEIRNTARDINVWVDSPYFERLAESHGVLVHPMRDAAVHIKGTDIHVRKRNRYFENYTLDSNINVFGPLTLLLQKRSSYIDPGRPLEQRKKDFRDIQILNDILATRNKVAS